MRPTINNHPGREDYHGELNAIGQADIVVGIPSYNNARTIGHVVKAVQAGLAKYFPDSRAVLINSDGGSKDDTAKIVQEINPCDHFQSVFIPCEGNFIQNLSVPYHGIPGKGSAFRAIFEAAARLGAKACAVVDSDLRSITPEWMELLIKPVLINGFDYVSPVYQRHKYDGTITNGIVYPLTRALYGKRVRQPIGGDFGFSGELAKFYLTKDVWDTDVARFGIDIWMTTTAIANKFKICQAFLGAKIHDAKDPSSDLTAMLQQVVGSAFSLMETYAPVWSKVSPSKQVPSFGFKYAVGVEDVDVNLEDMIERFKLGVEELSPVWSEFLPRHVTEFLSQSLSSGPEDFNMPDNIWVDIVYFSALAFHGHVMNRGHLLNSLAPLYIGKTASFVIDNRLNDPFEVERDIEELCLEFEGKKPFLVENWK